MKPMTWQHNLNTKQGQAELDKVLFASRALSEARCLRRSCEWIDDLSSCLPDNQDIVVQAYANQQFHIVIEHGRSLFEKCEFDSAAHNLRNFVSEKQLHPSDVKIASSTKDVCQTHIPTSSYINQTMRFLHFFSKYKSAEKKRIDLMSEPTIVLPKLSVRYHNELRDSLERSMQEYEPDGWLLYVYGLVLYKFRLFPQAINIFIRSIHASPMNWASWHMLGQLVKSRSELDKLDLPNCLYKILFYIMMRYELDISRDDPYTLVEQKTVDDFLNGPFRNSIFFRLLKAKHAVQSCDALELFSEIRKDDPYCVEKMDVYSNLLFKEKKTNILAELANELERGDFLTPEVNICIANSYRVRGQRNKAIEYLKRALRLNPDHALAWKMLGHEYRELKNMDKAIQAYRSAHLTDPRDDDALNGMLEVEQDIMDAKRTTI